MVVPGAISTNSIPTSLTVPGVDVDGKRFVIEVQDDLGIIEKIIQSVAGQHVDVYHGADKLSTQTDFNAITYSKDVNGVSKNFTLIYTRLLKIEGYEGTVLEITKE